MKNLYLILIVALMTGTVSCKSLFQKELTPEQQARQQALAATLPFELVIGGQQAQKNNEFCAKLSEPVSNNAEIKIDVESKNMIIATITPGTPEGLVQPGKKPLVLIFDNGTTTLDKTDTGQKLSPGIYIINVNADNKVASVIVEIEKPAKK